MQTARYTHKHVEARKELLYEAVASAQQAREHRACRKKPGTDRECAMHARRKRIVLSRPVETSRAERLGAGGRDSRRRANHIAGNDLGRCAARSRRPRHRCIEPSENRHAADRRRKSARRAVRPRSTGSRRAITSLGATKKGGVRHPAACPEDKRQDPIPWPHGPETSLPGQKAQCPPSCDGGHCFDRRRNPAGRSGRLRDPGFRSNRQATIRRCGARRGRRRWSPRRC